MISLIVALGKNREIGLNNQMLWHIREDFLHFKKTTMGHTLLMGRKTFESIGKPLPGRKTMILTRDESYQKESCETVHSLEEGLQKAKDAGEDELFIAGGGEVYKQALPHADKLYLSYVDYEGPADAYFPEIDKSRWQVTHQKEYGATEKSPAWTLKVLTRQ